MCQTVWIQIRPDNLLGLIWVQTIRKGYLQTRLIGKELIHSLNLHMQLYGGARGQIFGLTSLHLSLYYVCPSRESSDKTAGSLINCLVY